MVNAEVIELFDRLACEINCVGALLVSPGVLDDAASIQEGVSFSFSSSNQA